LFLSPVTHDDSARAAVGLRLALKINRDSGVLVSRVKADSAAQRGGILAGDVITAIDGHPIANATEFRRK